MYIKMPGMRCTVAVCNNSLIKTKNAGLNITYHQFPKNKNLRKIWVQKCHRSGNWNPSSCKVCSMHFTSEDYKRNSKSRKRMLKPTAVPSQYLTIAPEIPGLKKYKRRQYKYINDTYEISSKEYLSIDPNIVKTDTYQNYYQYENELENQINYEQYMVEDNRQDEQSEIMEIKYSQILANSENHFTSIVEEPYAKEAATQTENDRILQTCNFLVQKNIQLENKLKQLEMKLTRLENSQLK